MDGAGQERQEGEGWVRLTEYAATHPLVRRWWMLSAARFARETIRGAGGVATIGPVLRLYLPIEGEGGGPVYVQVEGAEAERLSLLLDAATADAPEHQTRAA